MTKIIIGSDHRGFEMKNKLIKELPFDFIDCGTNSAERCDYTQIVKNVVDEMYKTNTKFGVLICGSGVGVSIMANRFKNIRAALCYNTQVAIASRQHNDANIACFGADFMSEDDIKERIISFVETDFLNIEPYISRIKTLN